MENNYVFRNPEMPSKTFVMVKKNILITLSIAQMQYRFTVNFGTLSTYLIGAINIILSLQNLTKLY